jgi:hypothetical protein
MAGRKADVGGFTVGTNDIKGGFAGGALGYNWQAAGSPFVFGIEADGAWPGLAPGILLRCNRSAQACDSACINFADLRFQKLICRHQPLHGFVRVTAASRDGLVRRAHVMNDEIWRGQQGVTQIT